MLISFGQAGQNLRSYRSILNRLQIGVETIIVWNMEHPEVSVDFFYCYIILNPNVFQIPLELFGSFEDILSLTKKL